MEKKVEVTIYCAVYNHQNYIREALEGFVIQETNFAFEVLVHDDASTDGTVEIIREYELKYPDIIKPIYQKENIYAKGINRTYTYMLPNTKGRYIALCEGDDYWTDSRKLQRQYDYMEAHPECSLVVHETICDYVKGGYKEPFTMYDFSKTESCELDAADVINNHLLFHTSSLFFRTEYYYKNKNFILENRSYDYVTKILLATEGTVHVIPEVMSVYRKGTEGSWTMRVQNVCKHIEHHEYAISVLERIDAYRDYKYTKEIQENILDRKFNLYIEKREFERLKEEPYKTIFTNLSLKRKLVIYMKQYCPLLSNLVKNRLIYWKLKKMMSRKER